MSSYEWRIHHPEGRRRVVVTKELPGQRWLDILTAADCRVDICISPDVLPTDAILAAIGTTCDAAIGQLTEPWGEDLFRALRKGRRPRLQQLCRGVQQRGCGGRHPPGDAGGQYPRCADGHHC